MPPPLRRAAAGGRAGGVPVVRRRAQTTRISCDVIERWLDGTETGDRAEIEDLPEDLPFWKEIAASAENCIGTDCPRYTDCFVTRMRQRAAESDVVIVNHHLLCADAAVRQSAYGEVIPNCSHAIIDEAHQLEDVATQYFGRAVSSHRVDDLARDGMRLLATNMVADRERADSIAHRSANGSATMRGHSSRRPPSAALRAARGHSSGTTRACGLDHRRRRRFADDGAGAHGCASGAGLADISLSKDVPEDVHRPGPSRRRAARRPGVSDQGRRSGVRLLSRSSADEPCTFAPPRSTSRRSSAKCCSIA